MSEEKINSEQSQTTPPPAPTPNPDNGKLCAILSYLIIGIIWYFVDETVKSDEFAKFHVKQALVLVIISAIGTFMIGWIPVIGWIFGLITIILAVVGIVNAINGDKKQLPVIGHFENKFKF